MLIYVFFALVTSVLLGDKVDKAMISLILFPVVSFVIIAWTLDALRQGEMIRVGPRSLTESLSMNTRRITKRNNPVSFWTMIILSCIFATAIILFSVIGIYIRLI
jgi:hypothetical protein